MTSVADKLAQKSTRKTASKQVRLRLVHIDFWSVVKFAFLITVCLGIVTIVAMFLLWTVLVQTGVFDSVNSLLNDITGNKAQIKVNDFLDMPAAMLFAVAVSLLNIVVGTALAAIWTFIYNLSVKVTGGIVFGFTNG